MMSNHREATVPRNISFSMTTPQFLDGSKDVTRRMGWLNAKAGDVLQAVEKAMGLKKGEKAKALGLIRLVDVRRERLDQMIVNQDYGADEARREGFPDWNGGRFVSFFCQGHKGCVPGSIVTRIEFERLPSDVKGA
jgi:hypothetical protein